MHNGLKIRKESIIKQAKLPSLPPRNITAEEILRSQLSQQQLVKSPQPSLNQIKPFSRKSSTIIKPSEVQTNKVPNIRPEENPLAELQRIKTQREYLYLGGANNIVPFAHKAGAQPPKETTQTTGVKPSSEQPSSSTRAAFQSLGVEEPKVIAHA